MSHFQRVIAVRETALGRIAQRILPVIVAGVLAGTVAHPAGAQTADDESHAIERKLSAAYGLKDFDDANALGQKGLAGCDKVSAGIKVFCVSIFNQWLGDIANSRARYSDALAFHQQALQVREAGLAEGHKLIGQSNGRIGIALLALHRNSEAEVALNKALAIFENWRPLDPQSIAGTLSYLQRIYTESGRTDEQIAAARRALQLYTDAGAAGRAFVPRGRANLASAMHARAANLYDQKDYAGAEQVLTEAIRLIDPPAPGQEQALVPIIAKLGSVKDSSGQFAEAEALELRALDLCTTWCAPGDSSLPAILDNLAALYEHWQRPLDAISYSTRAISAYDQRKQEIPGLGYALWTLGRAQMALRHYQEAETALARAIQVLDRVLPEHDPQRAMARLSLGQLQFEQDDPAAAAQTFEAALAVEHAHLDAAWRSSIQQRLALAYRDQARYAEAERLLMEAIKIVEADGESNRAQLAAGLTNLASVFRRQMRYREAEDALLRALTVEQPTSGRAATLNLLGLIYLSTDRYEKAEPLLQEAMAIQANVLAADDPARSATLGNLATIDTALGRYDEAEAKQREALRLAQAYGPAQSVNIALHSLLLADVLLPRWKLDEAETSARRSLELYRGRLGANHPRTAAALKTVASIELARGRVRDAEGHYREALAIDEKVTGPDSAPVAADLLDVVPVLKRLGKTKDAKANTDRALSILTARYGAESPMCMSAVLAQEALAFEGARYDEARRLAERARQMRESLVGPDHLTLAPIWITAGRIDLAQRRLDDAAAKFDRAADLISNAAHGEHPLDIDVLEAKADLARARGNRAEEQRFIREALGIAEKLLSHDHPVYRRLSERGDRLYGAPSRRAAAPGRVQSL